MLSIFRPATELDRMREQRAAALECYSLALQSIAQYAVEIDPDQAAEFRERVLDLGPEWLKADRAEAMRTVQTALRSHLREYRDQSAEQMTRVRDQLRGAAAAMSDFADRAASAENDDHGQVKTELRNLEQLSEQNDLREIKSGIHAAVDVISNSLERAKLRSQWMVAQLRDEIRTLHREMEAERRAMHADPSSNAWNRQRLDLEIHEKLRDTGSFCAIAVGIRNLAQLRERHASETIEAAVKAMIARWRSEVGERTPIGRWNDEVFVSLLDVDAAAGVSIAGELAKKMRGAYTVQVYGAPQDLDLRVYARAIERSTGSDPASFIRKL